jgi:hypothetical protein
MEGLKIIEGTKEEYIYFLLKYTLYRIFPLYNFKDDGVYKLIRCNSCKKHNYLIPKDGYNFVGEYFHCKYCNTYNEHSSNSVCFNEEKLFVFTHNYILVDKTYKIKKNKIGDFYISPKKYKYKIIWTQNIIKVNKEINQIIGIYD